MSTGRRWWRRIGQAGLAVLAAGLLAAVAFACLSFWVPLPEGLRQPPARDEQFTDRNGIPLREQNGPDGFRGTPLPLQQVSDHLARATLAAEDHRFWEHAGVDWQAVARAAWHYVRHQRIISGASTITMQLVKISEPRPRTLRTKIIEAAQAMRLEREWGKEKILAEYLNRIDYGHGRIGCAAAAYYYFGKAPGDLSVAEAALLAGIPQAPTRFNPYLNFAGIKKRQGWILGQMREWDWLTEASWQQALREPLKLQPPRRPFQAPHFVDLLLALGPKAVQAHPGQAIRTSLDLELNRVAEGILEKHLQSLHGKQVENGALVVLDNRTGEVLALVGSEDYFSPGDGQVNGAWPPRSPGSALKPFTYLLALEHGATAATVIADVPTEFPTATGVFAPVNYNRQCLGPVRLREALGNSLNIPAVKVLHELGGAQPLLQALRQCGLGTLNHPAEHYGLGLTIGNAEVRLLELVNAYACLARLGEYRPFQLIAGQTGGSHRQFRADAAWLLADILSDNQARAQAFGQHSSLRFDFPVACKTGTSSDYRDNWAFGYTPEFTVGVWVGNFSGAPMREVSGVSGAAPVMHDLMVHLRQRFGVSWYAGPTNLVTCAIHPLTGKRIPEARQDAMREVFLAGSLPRDEQPGDYDAEDRVRLPAAYREWLASPQNRLAGRVVLDSLPTALRILAPLPGTVYYLDPDLAQNGNRLRLRMEGEAPVEWRCETLRLEHRSGQTWATLAAGRHQISARHPATGESAATWITVKSL
jgi:penicillin-binding protein 1C